MSLVLERGWTWVLAYPDRVLRLYLWGRKGDFDITVGESGNEA